MENILELLAKKSYKQVYDYLMEKILANPFILEALIKSEFTWELSEQDKELLQVLNAISNSNDKWLILLITQSVFYSIRDNEQYEKVVNKIKIELSKEHQSKQLDLIENQWSEFELSDKEHELPKAKIAVSFDEDYFKIKAEVRDNHFLDGNRAWRYGDGFYMNFALPEGKEIQECVDTRRFYSLGFSREEGKPLGVLVNHNGSYYLRTIPELIPEITIDEENKVAVYNIKIPFSFLKPFNPLVDEISGLYIHYTSQIAKNTMVIISNIVDSHADSEETNYRRFVPVTYSFDINSPLKIAGIFDNRLAQSENLKLTVHIHSPEEISDILKIKILNSQKDIVYKINKAINLKKGKNQFIENIATNTLATELLSLKVSIQNKEWMETFYHFSMNEIQEIQTKIYELKQNSNNILIENSIYTLEFKLQEILHLLKEIHYRDDPEILLEEITGIKNAITNCFENNSIYKRSGYLLSAFKSSIDNTFQPYSIILPENFDTEKEYHLFVGLHGSGVSEVQFIKSINNKNLNQLTTSNMIIVAPRGRDLSDFYIGQTELDVVNLITTVKKMFKIKKSIIYGFSMGGYGCWLMSLKHPELFDLAVICAGMPYFDLKPENDMRNYIDKSNNIDYLVIHSENDRSVGIEATDEFMEKLLANGFSVDYKRFIDMDHGNMKVSDIITDWLKNKLQIKE